jgi:acetyl-CoA C-acetyltransferase
LTHTRVGIIGIGWYGFRPSTPEASFREMMFEAAVRAYEEAGLDPRRDVDAFISCQEDFWEGIAISDEFAPEPIGGVLRPTLTVAGDGLQGVAQAYMMIRTGVFRVVAVEAHAKPSDVVTLHKVFELALDPVYLRPLEPPHPYFLAGLDARAYMSRTGARREHLAMVAVKNRNYGLDNPRASHAAPITIDDVLEAEPVVDPLTSYEIAGFTDAAVVVVLASEEVARRYDHTVWIDGVGWATETGTGALAWHEWGRMRFLRAAADMAYAQAGVANPSRAFDLAEVEDRFSYAELLAVEELRLVEEGQAHRYLEVGDFSRQGFLPVNPSGGSLAMGVAFEATGLARLLEAVLQLRGEAHPYQVEDARRAVVASWRGPPTFTGAVLVLSSE